MKALRLVLDTNVALDLFHWQDPVAAPLRAAAQTGRIELMTDAACFAEFAHVLVRPEFGLSPAAAAAAVAAYRQIALPHAGDPAQRPRQALPRCRDPDDQKFLELAREVGADLLVTRDKALLVLARRKHATAGFRVVQPAQAVALLARAEAPADAKNAAQQSVS